jgi:hypothetical protein
MAFEFNLHTYRARIPDLHADEWQEVRTYSAEEAAVTLVERAHENDPADFPHDDQDSMEVEVLDEATGTAVPYRVVAHLNWSFHGHKRDLEKEAEAERRMEAARQRAIEAIRRGR